MKFKTGCALAVLTLICFQSSHGGILKKWFSKDNANVLEQDKKEEADNTSSDSKENASQESQENNDAGTSSEAEKTTDETKPEEKAAEVPATPAKSGDSNPIIAKIGKRIVRLSEVTELMKEIPPELLQKAAPEKLFEIIRKQLVDNILLLNYAYKVGIDKKPEFTRQLQIVKDRILLNFTMVQALGAKLQDNTLLRKIYTDIYLRNFKSQKEYSFHFVTFKDAKDAEAAIASLKKGEDFEKLLVGKNVIASSAGLDVSDKFIGVELMPDAIKKAMKELKKGEYSKTPVNTSDGYSVFKVLAVRDSTPRKFEDPEMQEVLKRLLLQTELQNFMGDLYKQNKIELFKEDGSPDDLRSLTAPLRAR